MDNASILTALKGEHADIEKHIRGAQARLGQLQVAIDALEGRTTQAPAPSVEGPSVVDMIEGVARDFPAGATFDHTALLSAARQVFPEQAVKLKRGVYNAVSTLIKKGKFLRAPGGYKLAP